MRTVRFLSLLTLILTVTPFTSAQSKPAAIAIVGGRLLDGNEGPPLDRSVIVIQGNKISTVGRLGEVQIPGGAKVVDASGMTVMPGMIDMHVHLMILGHGDYFYWFPWLEKEKKAMEIMKISARQLLMHGVTTVRDVAGPLEESLSLREAIKKGDVAGPRLFVTGPFIARNCWMLSEYYCHPIKTPEEAGQWAEKLSSAGVDWLKPWLGVTEDDLKAVVAVARKHKIKVATHGGNEAEIMRDIRAGVDTLEHTGAAADMPFRDEVLRAMVDSRVWVVPTMMQGWVYKVSEDYPERLDSQEVKQDFGPDLFANVRNSLKDFQRLNYYFPDIHDRIRLMPAKWKQMIQGGVQILMGTDSGTPLNYHTESGRREMELFVADGMAPLRAISAATRFPAMALGQGDYLGTIEPGKLADIIVVDGDPLESMAYLKNVVHVFKDGTQYK